MQSSSIFWVVTETYCDYMLCCRIQSWHMLRQSAFFLLHHWLIPNRKHVEWIFERKGYLTDSPKLRVLHFKAVQFQFSVVQIKHTSFRGYVPTWIYPSITQTAPPSIMSHLPQVKLLVFVLLKVLKFCGSHQIILTFPWNNGSALPMGASHRHRCFNDLYTRFA